MREAKKEIRHNERDLDRELANLNREEAELIRDIKKAAANNQQGALKTMAKNLVQLRNQKDRLMTMKATVKSAGYKATMMGSQAAVGQVMGTVAGVSHNGVGCFHTHKHDIHTYALSIFYPSTNTRLFMHTHVDGGCTYR